MILFQINGDTISLLLNGLADQLFSIVLLVTYVIYSHGEKKKREQKHDTEIGELKDELKEVRRQFEAYRTEDSKVLTGIIERNTDALKDCNNTMKLLDVHLEAMKQNM